ncbi:protein LKAAEAR1 [Microcaecilia unicolor]|uniref:Protein LKAAEAR1 n=1 Tax=Microcaecilia unicolor TaxID=1415580 RepID=A0A6P7YYZ7_9AMPH|nr:protein LKAAEAR1 [Microcaecilia unicolor]XP_030068490.1 protein LKAAEAR1 [Microcaecilia unicolor]
MAVRGTNMHKEKFVTRNRNNPAQGEMRKMAPQQRARHMGHEELNKEVMQSVLSPKNRPIKQDKLRQQQEIEQIKQAKVVGQLKAAEARNRIRVKRLRFQCMRAQEIKHLISCQPRAMAAVRLEVFLPPQQEIQFPRDPIGKLERARVEDILGDNEELTIKRTS